MLQSPSPWPVLLLLSLVPIATGCRSVGKLGFLRSKEIPVLTRSDDADFPAPSSAATPTNITAAAAAGESQPANGSSFAAPLAAGGDQTLSGVQYPKSATAGNYPTTNYQTFPSQPESSPGNAPSTTADPRQQTAGARPTGQFAASPQTAAPPTTRAPHADVQQGLYAAHEPSSTTPPAVADSRFSDAGNWPTPLASQTPDATTSATNPGSSTEPSAMSRDSGFSGTANTAAANVPVENGSFPTSRPVVSAEHYDSGTAAVNTAAPIATAQPAAPTSQFSGNQSDVAPTSHYEQLAQQPSGPWRPGSTTTLPQ